MQTIINAVTKKRMNRLKEREKSYFYRTYCPPEEIIPKFEIVFCCHASLFGCTVKRKAHRYGANDEKRNTLERQKMDF